MRADKYPMEEGSNGKIWHIAKGVRVNETKNGTYELCVQIGNQRHRRRIVELDAAINAAELTALKFGLKTLIKADVAESDVDRIYTFERASEDWMKVGKPNWEAATIEKYSGLLNNFILKAFGGFPIDMEYEKWREKIKGFLAELRAIRSPKTVEVAHTVVSGVFSEAIDSGRVRYNPASGLLKRILPPKKKRNLSKPDPFTRQDLHLVLEQSHKVLNRDVAMVIEVLAGSGMRLGEAIAMRIDHLDVKNSQYFVKEKIRHGVHGVPKGGEQRLIDLPEALVAKLQGHIRWLKEKMLAEGKPVDLLFPGITERIVQGGFRRACLAARLRVRTPHDLRHTYATLLLMDHYSPAYVQKQLGHSSIEITIGTYGHWIPGEGRKDLDKTLGKEFGPKKPTSQTSISHASEAE